MLKKFRCLFLVLLLLFIGIFTFVKAQNQEERSLEIEYPEIGGIKPETVSVGLPTYVQYIFNLGLLIGAAVLVGILIYGGIQYLLAAGRVPVLIEARRRILLGFFGIFILFAGYLILQTINPELVIFKLPLLEKTEFCKEDADCPGKFECKEGKCVPLAECAIDTDCVGFPDYVCKEIESGKKFCVYEPKTLIVQEFPLGQAIEGGIWEKVRTTKTKNLLQALENFLKKEIKINSKKFNRLSDLNKYLESLARECTCAGDASEKGKSVQAICSSAAGKPGLSCLPGDCLGDPCAKNREIIDEIRE
ncbi:MAG: hypothetical protein ACPLW9_00430, partial [Minisyncoccales bacterium]